MFLLSLLSKLLYLLGDKIPGCNSSIKDILVHQNYNIIKVYHKRKCAGLLPKCSDFSFFFWFTKLSFPSISLSDNKYKLFTSWEVRIGKNCSRGHGYCPRPQASGQYTRQRAQFFPLIRIRTNLGL